MQDNQVVNQEEIMSLLQAPVDFDEIVPEPVTVTWIDFQEYKDKVGDLNVIRRKPVKRSSLINTYVPVKVLNKMMAGQDKMRKLQALRAKDPTQVNGDIQQEMVIWMADQILNVWKLSEPEMTLDKLLEGVDLKKILGLFSLFFGNLLTGMNKPQ